VKEEYLTPLLSKLAYWLHVNKPTGIATEREVYIVLGEEWARLNELHWDPEDPSPKVKEEVRKFLEAVHEHTGLFVERAPRRYGFMHLTFEEYYVARYLIAPRKRYAELIRQHLHQVRWEEPILLALGFVGLEYPADAMELVETAILAQGEEAKELQFAPSKYEDLLGQDYLFALRCLGDNIPVRPRLLLRLVKRLVNELLHRSNSARFQRYRRVLDERLVSLEGSESATVILPLLVAVLKDPDVDVRSRAAGSLGQLRQSSPEVVSGLVATLKDRNVDVRSRAAMSLGQLGQSSPEVVSGLVAALKNRNVDVRFRAAEGLGRLGQSSPEMIDVLCANLRAAEGWLIRRDAAKLLGQIGHGDKVIIDTLWCGILDEDSDVRKACVQALVGLSKQDSTLTESLEKEFVQAIQNADFQKVDRIEKRPAYDYVFEGLWSLIVDSAIEDR
jgi:hypothetical protein